MDILVNVAGTNIRKRFEDYSREEYEHVMQTNLHGLIELTQLVGARHDEARQRRQDYQHRQPDERGGASLPVGLRHHQGRDRAVHESRWRRSGRSIDIQVNCIAPGFILTDLNRDMWQSDEMKEWLKGVQANDRLGTPGRCRAAGGFLASPGANYITGQVIAVDGGYTTTAKWPVHDPGGATRV